MAEQQYDINSVTTFVAELQGLPVEEVLRIKFTGRHTARSLAAARRISAKRQRVKVPAHLMRQLWRITGGWVEDRLAAGWHSNPGSGSVVVRVGGDLSLILRPDYPSTAFLKYRGYKVGSFNMNSGGWIKQEVVVTSAKALGVPWSSPA